MRSLFPTAPISQLKGPSALFKLLDLAIRTARRSNSNRLAIKRGLARFELPSIWHYSLLLVGCKLLQRRFKIILQGEKLLQAHELNGLGHAGIRNYLQAASLRLGLLNQPHQGTKARTIDEVNLSEAQDDIAGPFINESAQNFQNRWLGEGIEEAGKANYLTVFPNLAGAPQAYCQSYWFRNRDSLLKGSSTFARWIF